MENKWKLILHEQCEDPYFEITNGPISLCSPTGHVGETEDEEDEIFKKVADALNKSGIDFHSENALELKQHIEIMALQYKLDELHVQAQCMADVLAELRMFLYQAREGAEINYDAIILKIEETPQQFNGTKEVVIFEDQAQSLLNPAENNSPKGMPLPSTEPFNQQKAAQ